MKKGNINLTLWMSGLLAGVLVGAYFYRNQEQFAPQQKKLKGVIADLKKTAGDLGNKALKASQEQLKASKDVAKKAVDSVKNAG
ncbi:MAG: hypothetical protein P8O16_15380 [Algoriphagus sp.]|uniref:hypothetical protein n=1 Tax=Algoriphagus sp. TaxID=1872435 RepID=UPI00260DF729|nr:hypothetical protein [Algoriphagus sp.]MDG1278663.1 hypothetical protein [Algoriphagus sp.]